ncbi:hypothetical protein EATG_02536 [Escherichia coli H605]|uniref:Uncharacterized protein n=1 Tax=Escherichia coli H605 TaxID=656410 RepID=A0AAJ3NY86_ECOLX|nr:hypothetical protein EATG_02536 [Escherichia coli H605]
MQGSEYRQYSFCWELIVKRYKSIDIKSLLNA